MMIHNDRIRGPDRCPSRWPYLITIVLLGLAGTTGLAAQRALLVGIPDYPGTRNDLPGVEEDIRLMRTLLAGTETVVLALPGAATEAAILRALDHAVEQGRPGDSFLFYYSGHGYPVADDNGDEADGQDESLVTADGRYIRDDVLQLRIRRLLKRQVQTVFILDCCYAGDAWKGEAGPKVKAFLPEASVAPGAGALARLQREAPPGRAKGAGQAVALAGLPGGRFVFLSSCSEFEAAFSGEKHSPYTGYLVEGCVGRAPADTNQDGRVTFMEAHRYAHFRLSGERFTQTPTIEATGVNLAETCQLYPALFEPAPRGSGPYPKKNAVTE
jgi:hypothetical protein